MNSLISLGKNFPGVDFIAIDPKNEIETDNKNIPNRRRFDFLKAPFRWNDLQSSLEQTRSFKNFQKQLEKQDEDYHQVQKTLLTRGGLEVVGASKCIKSILPFDRHGGKNRRNICPDAPVRAEQGKKLVARGIHIMSNRYQQQFHAVNCSAIPDTLFESEFFGYKKGAFTGALEKATGWFETAHKSTLFLDEITELPYNMQSKFLRVLDDKLIYEIGSHKEIRVDTRIISATNQDLHALLGEKSFREDLFYRLNTFRIHIPPLRERKDDIPVLLDHFVTEASARMKKSINPVETSIKSDLMEYSFPGNVRELKNMAERAVIMCQGRRIRFGHFGIEHPRSQDTENTIHGKTFDLEEIERQTIIEALEQAHNNKSKAATLLKVSRQSLDRKLVKFGIYL